MSLRVVPVLDLQAGRAVRALGGDRAHYQPLRTPLHEDPDPIGLARAYLDTLGLRDLYLADLDAIAGSLPATALYRALSGLGLTLWVDAGVRDASSLPPLLTSGVHTIIVGLETVRGPDALAEVLDAVGPARTVFSLDLRAGIPLIAPGADWTASDPRTIVETALALGLRRILLLELTRIGTGQGIGTFSLLSDLAAAHPDREISVGGGIAGRDEMRRLARAGASALLIGSALHDGRIGREELAEVRRRPS